MAGRAISHAHAVDIMVTYSALAAMMRSCKITSMAVLAFAITSVEDRDSCDATC